ncbi:MAG: DUF4254 domain-containing protein [Bacteroidales bacterium]|nr:DUF4254 domain-containing protein [Bacteroidales bacterium]
MTLKAENFNNIFIEAISKYHIKNTVNQELENNYLDENTIENLLFKKCWIDTVQWHYEDLIRDPEIVPEEAIILKRKIDISNQHRTDLVELIDDYFYNKFKNIEIHEKARLSTESLGWAIDRLSILNLKVYHWKEETQRADASTKHTEKSKQKLNILNTQYNFLTEAINQLIKDISTGKVIAQTFKQMKMYNDDETNPVLRKLKQKK